MQATSVLKWGNSQGIRLGKSIMEECGLHIGDRVTTHVEGGSVIITPVRRTVRPIDVDALFLDYSGDYQPREDGFASPAGQEVM